VKVTGSAESESERAWRERENGKEIKSRHVLLGLSRFSFLSVCSMFFFLIEREKRRQDDESQVMAQSTCREGGRERKAGRKKES